MTRPLDRGCELPQLGELDEEHGEFWVENPFLLKRTGKNISAYERNCLFLNVDGTHFIDASFASGADIDSDSRSVVAADFDRDGACDLLVGSDGGGPLRLFSNALPATNAHLRVQLRGTASNYAGIGARVIVQCGQRQIVRDVFGANGFMGQAPPELLVGLGDAKRIDKLTIRWPTGESEHYTDLAVNQTVELVEGQTLRVIE